MKGGLFRFVNQLIHRVTGASLLAYCALNGVNIYKQRPMTSPEMYAFCGVLLVNSASAVILLENLPYTNSRIHRVFALSVISNVSTAVGLLRVWPDAMRNGTLFRLRHLLNVPSLIGGVYAAVVSLLEMVDVLWVATFGKHNKNLSPIRRRKSKSMVRV